MEHRINTDSASNQLWLCARRARERERERERGRGRGVRGLRPVSDCNVFTGGIVSPSAFSRRAVVSYWRRYVHEVLVNRLGGLSLPRKSVVRLTDRPDMTLDVYRGRKTTMQCNGRIVVRMDTLTLMGHYH